MKTKTGGRDIEFRFTVNTPVTYEFDDGKEIAADIVDFLNSKGLSVVALSLNMNVWQSEK